MLFREGTQCRAGAVDLVAGDVIQAHAVGPGVGGQIALTGLIQRSHAQTGRLSSGSRWETAKRRTALITPTVSQPALGGIRAGPAHLVSQRAEK